MDRGFDEGVLKIQKFLKIKFIFTNVVSYFFPAIPTLIYEKQT